MTDLSATLDILTRLITFPTVSDRSNRDLIAYVKDYLQGLDLSCHVFDDDTGEKQGLIAQIGPDVEGGVIMSGHTDVVPVDGQDWSSDPWALTLRDRRYYGRGSCDMKGFLALVLAAVPQMIAAPLTRPIQIAFSYDEEVGCLGTAPLLEKLSAHYPKADRVIVGEPTDWRVVTGHKGGIGTTTRITGKAAHSSMPTLGVSAISAAAQLVQWHDQQTADCWVRTTGDTGFTPPHSTLQVGTIHGGTAANIVPDSCVLENDIRFVPPETAEGWLRRYRDFVQQLEARMQQAHAQAQITLHDIEVIPAMMPEGNGPAEQLTRQLTGDNSDNCVSYQTEAGHFQQAGYSTVVCGPGNIAQAHQPDEFITAQQLQQGQVFMTKLIESLSA